MEETKNLIQKLAEIRKMSDAVKKDRTGHAYTYTDINTILAKVTAGMKKYRVSLVPNIVSESANVEQVSSTNTKIDKTGHPFDKVTTEFLVSADMVFRWVNDDNPEEVLEVPWFTVGSQQDPSQAFGSGLTYCTRYFLMSFFQIAQSDLDVDAYRAKQRAAEEDADTIVAKEIIARFDEKVRAFLSAHSEDVQKEVKEFIGKYVKNSNYLSIKDPELARRLDDDFSEKFTDGFLKGV